MTINTLLAQDVWKDIGKNVQFTILELKREDQAVEKEAIIEFADRYQAILRSLRIRAEDSNLKATLGFSRKAWDYLFPDAPVPAELEIFEGLAGPEYKMPGTKGDIFLHIRANDEMVIYEVLSLFRKSLKDVSKVIDETKGFRYFEGRSIIGFIDGTEVPTGVEQLECSLIGEEDPEFINGSYAFAQKWRHDMDYWDTLPTETQEKAIGRKKFNDLELEDDEKFTNAHSVVSKYEVNGEEKQIIRMNVPFSDPSSGKTGTYFIGYANHWTVMKQMLIQMVEQSDYLLTFSTVMSGQLFFIPSITTLNKIADGEY
ncbi:MULTISPECIES: Dyp-type peroxidase [Pasteurellaceae]|uniref:Dyp-type peroxidase family protein n=1 Tax=Pasteurella bettyae CCUG 2042 TaxID=1095749 RepID=I3DA13_9PAST|nr:MULTISPECIES: Dyp-type peroxidase [Pasteurellaceae]EIJ68556.1 Dyp-type peroxidase family protein [Pasteurella bettyae CCUG 2042]SUB22693.1 protein YfeX [Pasteurella bettyae]